MAEMAREELKRQPMRYPLDRRRTLVAIIDEDPLLAELYSIELSDVGYEVRAGNDVESAPELIAAWRPDLVLLDPYYRNEFRWDVLTEIRERNVQLPVLACLPFEMRPNDLDCRLVDACVIKSFDMSGLFSKVRSLLATKAAGKAQA